MSKYGVFSGPYFPVLGLNTKICGVKLPIQSECRKIQTRKNSVCGHFSRSECSLYNLCSVGGSKVSHACCTSVFVRSIAKGSIYRIKSSWINAHTYNLSFHFFLFFFFFREWIFMGKKGVRGGSSTGLF